MNFVAWVDKVAELAGTTAKELDGVKITELHNEWTAGKTPEQVAPEFKEKLQPPAPRTLTITNRYGVTSVVDLDELKNFVPPKPF